jgi:hypothetical protein
LATCDTASGRNAAGLLGVKLGPASGSIERKFGQTKLKFS